MNRLILPSLAALALAACGGGSEETPDAPQTPDTPAETGGQAPETPTAPAAPQGDFSDIETQGPAPEPATPPAEPTEQDVTAILAALGPAFAEADVEAGRRRYAICRSCHTLNEGGRHQVGPNLYGVFGREAGSAEGFRASRQVMESGVVWSAETMDEWLTNPRRMIPGNRMSYVGMRDETQRRDLIAYLATQTGFEPGAEAETEAE